MTEYCAILAVAIAVAIGVFYCRKKAKKEDAKVPQGIQLFNSSGGLIFDLSTATTYVLGTGKTGTSDGSISNSGIKAGRTWIAVTGTAVDNAEIPVFTVTNGKISWKFKRISDLTNVANVTFMYGVF